MPRMCHKNVVVAVLAFNVVGDGMRDAADPYASR